MMKGCFVSFFLILFLSGVTADTSVLMVDTYDTTVHFYEKKIVRFYLGDNPHFKNRDFDDKQWELVSLPMDWTKKHPDWDEAVWYRLHIRFPDSLPGRATGINLGKIFDTDETWFNGELIGRNGNLCHTASGGHDIERIYEIPQSLIVPGEDNVVAIRVERNGYVWAGMFKGELKVGPMADLQHDFYRREIIKLIFIIIAVVMGFFFILFYIRIPRRKEYLLFGIFCCLISLYFYCLTQIIYLFFNNYDFLLRLEYAVLYIVFPVFNLFILTFFKYRHHILHYLYYICTITSVVLVFTLPRLCYLDYINMNFVQYTWIIPVATLFIVPVREYKKNKDARLLFYAILVLFLVLINDIIVSRNAHFIKNMPFLTTYAFLVFIICNGIILVNRYVNLSSQVDHLFYLAITDGQTQLIVHRHFHELLAKELLLMQEQGNRLALLMIDIDFFKTVNDTCGHQAGDVVLKKTGEIIKSSIRQSDIAARYGGDEFVIALSSCNIQNARSYAKKLRKTIQDTAVQYKESVINITVSIGIAVYSDHAVDKETLIKAADDAMYHAKHLGRNRIMVAEKR